MNKTTYLLLKIAEEAAEVAQMAAKTAQFGTDERYQNGPSNLERLTGELKDLATCCALLSKRQRDVGGEPFEFGDTVTAPQWSPDKVDRVDQYFRAAVLNPDLVRGLAAGKQEPFDARAWAAENLAEWSPGLSGLSEGPGPSAEVMWTCEPGGFRVSIPGRVTTVPLAVWADARRSLGFKV